MKVSRLSRYPGVYSKEHIGLQVPAQDLYTLKIAKIPYSISPMEILHLNLHYTMSEIGQVSEEDNGRINPDP